MDLLIDLGNSGLRWGLACGGQVFEQGRIGTKAGITGSSEVHSFLGGLRPPERVIGALVAPPESARALASMIRDLWGYEPVFPASPQAGWGVDNGYSSPAQLGIDRFAALVAARRREPAGAVVVDVGTAVTIDILIGGVHRGGYILPGPQLMADSLAAGTAAVSAAPADPSKAPGVDTAAGVGRGIGHAITGAVAEVRAHLEAQGLSGLPCLITGGGAGLLMERVASPRYRLRGLVIEGLARMAAEPMDEDACESCS